VEEVALVECQLLPVLVGRFIVVQRLDDFLGRDNGKGAFRGQRVMGRRFLVFVALERSPYSLVTASQSTSDATMQQ
jgi:hypothetical protein